MISNLRVCERRKSDFWFVLSATFVIVVAENILKLYQVHVRETRDIHHFANPIDCIHKF